MKGDDNLDGKKIKELEISTNILDTDDFVLENGTPKTKRAKISDLKALIAGHVKTLFPAWEFANIETTSKSVPAAINELKNTVDDHSDSISSMSLKIVNLKTMESVFSAKGIERNLPPSTWSDVVFSYSVAHSGFVFCDIYSVFPEEWNRRIIAIYKNGVEMRRHDDTTGTSGIGSRYTLNTMLKVSKNDVITAKVYIAAGGIITSDVDIFLIH